MKLFFSFLVVCTTILLAASLHGVATAAQFGIAQNVSLSQAAPDGSILSLHEGTYELSSEPFDKGMVGVIAYSPPIELIPQDGIEVSGKYSMLTDGIVSVRVNTEGGPIAAGDLITASSVAGEGMRATKSGFMLGIAQAATTQAGTIPVQLAIKFTFMNDSPPSERIGTGMLEALKLAGLSVVDDPVTTLRYVLGAGVVIASLIISFFTVSKVARGGVEAIGRNPLASSAIMISIITNVVFSVGIVGAGVASAYVITTLGK